MEKLTYEQLLERMAQADHDVAHLRKMCKEWYDDHKAATARAAAAEAEVARLREEKDRWEQTASSAYTTLKTERDALRAKLEKVRAELDAVIDFEQGWKLQERLLIILDGEGDT